MNKKIEKILSKEYTHFYSRYLIGTAGHLTYLARGKELAPCHISPQQVEIIFNLYYLKKLTLTELAGYLERGVNTVSNQLIMMEKDGLLKRTRETPKSTLLSFELTRKGINTFKYALKEARTDKSIMSVLSEEERLQLISMLKKIITRAKKYRRT